MFFSTAWKVHYNSDRTGRAADRAEAGVGAQGRRRGGPASFQHSRQRVCRGHGGFHRRHAGDPGSGRSEPGRFRVPGHDRARRALEDGPVAARRQCDSTRRATKRCADRELDAAIEAGGALANAVRRAAGDSPCSFRRGGVPRRWRPLPAGGVRAQRARFEPALPRARAGGAAARGGAAGHHRHHAGRALAADSLRHGALSREALLDALDACERAHSGPRRHRGAFARSCTCRCRGTIRRRSWRSANTCSRCGPTRRGARATSNSSGASTASIRWTKCGASCSTRVIWCWGWATFTWARRWRRRWIRGTAW